MDQELLPPKSTRTPPRRWPWLMIVIVSGVIIGIAWIGRSWANSPARAELLPMTPPEAGRIAVTVASVTPRPIRRTISVVGSLRGQEEIPITAKVDGRVVRVYHDLGDRVKPGELLVEMDPTDAQLAVEEAKRAYELELARLDRKDLPKLGEPFNVSELPAVVKAVAEEKNAIARMKRTEKLSSAISQEESQQRETELAVARSMIVQAKLEAQVNLAAARQKLAALASAEQRVKDLRVVAPEVIGMGDIPVDFVVASRKVSPGEYLRSMPGESVPLFQLIIDRPLKLVTAMPERFTREVKIGMPADVRVEAAPSESVAGTIARISPAIDRAARTFAVEIHIPNDDGALRPGGFAKAEILTRITTAMTVPNEAIVSFAGVTKVFVIRDQIAHPVPVKLGATLYESTARDADVWVEVEGALQAGDLVVRTGQSALAEGVPVRIRKPESMPNGVAQVNVQVTGAR